jgi:hypothetical protein
MGIERRMSRFMFLNNEIVELRQTCFTPGRVFRTRQIPGRRAPRRRLRHGPGGEAAPGEG